MSARKPVWLKELAFSNITVDVGNTRKLLPDEYKDIHLPGETPNVCALDLLINVPNGKLWELRFGDGIRVMLYVGDKPTAFGEIMLGHIPTLDLDGKFVVRIDHTDLLNDLLSSLRYNTNVTDITPYLDTSEGVGDTVFARLHKFCYPKGTKRVSGIDKAIDLVSEVHADFEKMCEKHNISKEQLAELANRFSKM